jgi:hypothetical protein
MIAMSGATRSIDSSSTAMGYNAVQQKCKKVQRISTNKIFALQAGHLQFLRISRNARNIRNSPRPCCGWCAKNPQFHFPLKPMALDHHCLIWRLFSGGSRSIRESGHFGHWLPFRATIRVLHDDEQYVGCVTRVRISSFSFQNIIFFCILYDTQRAENTSIIKKNAPIIGKERSREGTIYLCDNETKKVRNCLLDAQRLSLSEAGRP